MSTTVPKPRGRHFFANPGPTNIPDSVLRAIDRPSIDFHDPDFVEVYDAAFEGVKRVLRTSTICSCTTPPATARGRRR